MNSLYPGRFASLDMIRGIAVLGILVINIQTYTLFAFLQPEQVYDLRLDIPEAYLPVEFLIRLLFKGQFYTLYSFLFGLGFYLMFKKNEQAGLDAAALFRRRLWILLCLGLIHALVFWFGDVLHKYALLGFTLLYFNRKSIPSLIRWIGILAAFFIVLQVVKILFFPVSAESAAANKVATEEVIMQVIHTWRKGSLTEVMTMQKLGVVMLYAMSAQNGFMNIIHYEMMFLLGLIAGKMRYFYRIETLRAKALMIAWSILPVALLLKFISCLPLLAGEPFSENLRAGESLIISVSEFLGIASLTFVYLTFLSVTLRERPSGILLWIAHAGRLGLTNYIMQTFICMMVFYGYAGGMAGRLTLAGSFVPVALIYAFQLWFSSVWLRYHTLGPMENLWRVLTYRKDKTGKGWEKWKTEMQSQHLNQ
ncbi:hypothetical protein DYBT9275_01287 [Dyadobacter sp. CECT 9275]|uniref:DUF418 domain-containing protein n=1 Tax=Dyadobacter helix TaxID=2822344 RepID=A0A916NBF0_9BACT|nr:DUF418 domain-containing protein [Dyadobacter sp. CECT 9275]CAG4994007.1 hypothetical protein DYBT9275_01287 [Dyadobacter sp. CECT 9275]